MLESSVLALFEIQEFPSFKLLTLVNAFSIPLSLFLPLASEVKRNGGLSSL